jgi:protein ImuB
MLWLALHLPELSLEAYCATLDSATALRPVALVAGHRVNAVNAAAAACGIRPGCQRATAQALSAQLLLAEADPVRDAAALQAVAHAALAFTPAVTVPDADTVLLEVQASLRLFGGAAALTQRLLQALAPLGHRLQWAAAPTALGAALLARWGLPAAQALGPQATQLPALQALLDRTPVQLLRPVAEAGGPAVHEALQAMGLQTLGQLRRQPRSGLARRFGALLLDVLDRAYGLRPDPRPWLELPAVFETRLELQARADNTGQLLHAAAVLLARLVAWAQARQARVAAFTLLMQHEPRHRGDAPPATELHLALAEPALDATHLQRLLRERLAQLQLPAPTLELCLHCHHLVQAPPPQAELFPGGSSAGEGLTRLLETLRARLGDTQVLGLQPVADHRPERASQLLPLRALPAAATADAAAQAAAEALRQPAHLPLHRPAWLLPEPQALAERDALPLLDGRPLQLLSGPDRIETGWWDTHPVARDYFIAQAADGSLVWIWRARLPAPPGQASWFLHGRFA